MKAIIIGAGVAGLGIGWRLAQQGVQVTVIERAQPGQGASWAAAGLLLATNEAGEANAPEAELARRAAQLWPAFAAEIESESGHGIHYRASGRLVIAQTREEHAALVAQAQAGAGEVLAPDSARDLEPRLRPDLVGALWEPRAAQVDNRALGPALTHVFVRSGGSLLVNETVVRFECRDGRIQGVKTPFAMYQGDVYVLAAGAWSARIEGLPPDALPPVIPVKGEMLALEPPSDEALPRPSIGGRDVYLVAQRNRLLVGATVTREGFDTSLTGVAADWLLASATALIPSLQNWPVAEQWAGLRPGSPDDLPLLGKSTLEGLFIASGQFRNGILYTPAIADAMSALLLGRNAGLDIAAFDPRRFVTDMAARGGWRSSLKGCFD
jgi:glycine oxidase